MGAAELLSVEPTETFVRARAVPAQSILPQAIYRPSSLDADFLCINHRAGMARIGKS